MIDCYTLIFDDCQRKDHHRPSHILRTHPYEKTGGYGEEGDVAGRGSNLNQRNEVAAITLSHLPLRTRVSQSRICARVLAIALWAIIALCRG